MKHDDVAAAFIQGVRAQNSRMFTDGLTLFLGYKGQDPEVLATKTADELVLVQESRGRSGALARKAAQRMARMTTGRYVFVPATATRPRSSGDLVDAWTVYNAQRLAAGMPAATTFKGSGHLTAGKVIDLMAALTDALESSKGKPPTRPATAKSRPAPSPDLGAELERLAAADRAPETEPGKTP